MTGRKIGADFSPAATLLAKTARPIYSSSLPEVTTIRG
jgi:hypothetical protein